MVVDDEVYVVESLYNFLVNVKHLELDVYKAYSAVEALDWINKANFDIVVTDIRMPEMDGLTMVNKIKSSWPQCRIIFLTGYNEFDYIYNAIKFEGVSYLLKSESYDKILEAIEKAVKVLDVERYDEEMIDKIKQQNKVALPFIRKEFILNVLKGSISIDNELYRFPADLQWPFKPEKPFMLVMACLEHRVDKEPFIDKFRLFNTINIIADTVLNDAYILFQVEIEPSSVIWLVQPRHYQDGTYDIINDEHIWDESISFLDRAVETIQNTISEKLDVFVSFAIDNERGDLSSIFRRYDELKQLSYIFFCNSSSMLIHKEDFRGSVINSGNDKIYKTLFRSYIRNLEKLEYYLENGDEKEIVSWASGLGSIVKDCKNMPYSSFIELYLRTAAIVLNFINRHNLLDTLALKVSLYKLTNHNEHSSWEEAFEYLTNVLIAISELKNMNRDQELIITNVKEYINDHLTDNLSLIQISGAVYYNPSYLSRLFKSKTGMNLFEYISDIRLKKAEELLLTTEIKVNEMALQIGFSSPNYFYQFFRRSKGITPQEYRDRYRK
jgi:Response regulator containing CheY-like receiver domain and AraC-type DNA-binding domain